MRYENERCPVCGKSFEINDDVVVCPDCGTPHHRECYASLGNCANSHMHSEGFVWSPDEPVVHEEEAEAHNDFREETVTCPHCGARNRKGTFLCIQCGVPLNFDYGAQEEQRDFFVNGERVSPDEFIDEENTVKVRDASAFIVKRREKYIGDFIAAKKNGKMPKYNFAALIFGPLWFFYRKITKVGAALAGVYFAVSCFIMTFYVRTFSDFIKVYAENYGSAAEDFADELVAVYEKCVSSHPRDVMCIMLLVLSLVLLNFVMGFFANKLYLSKIKEGIERVRSMEPQGGMYYRFLGAKGGTSLLGAFNAAFIMYLLINIISSYVIKF